jgi:hypothetical protein
VTNYCRNNDILIKVDGEIINVYSSYRAQLKAFTKHKFDPFRRRYRINYYYHDNKFVETTIGQLNFFRWLIENKVLDYIYANLKAIEDEMAGHLKSNAELHNQTSVLKHLSGVEKRIFFA